MTRIALFFLAVLATGCAPKLTFDLTVTNQTSRPVTLGLVKDGPPFEPEFSGPEHFAIAAPAAPQPPWGHVIPPGRSIDSGHITGTFPDDTHAYVRIYAGEHSNAELMAISEPSPDRIEILIFPGPNKIIVTDSPKGLHAERIPIPR